PSWRKLVLDYRVSGINVHDARIAAAMLLHQVPRLLTFDQDDFKRYAHLTVVDPKSIRPLRRGRGSPALPLHRDDVPGRHRITDRERPRITRLLRLDRHADGVTTAVQGDCAHGLRALQPA